MTLIDHPTAPPAVPPRLAEPLRIVAGRARLLAWFHALFQLAILCAVVWLLVVLTLGSRLQVPTWASIPLVLTAWAIISYGAFRVFRQLFRRRGGLAGAALLVDNALPDSQERISSAIELTQEPNPDFRGSPELVAVLMRQAVHHADSMDPGQIISGRQVLRWLTSFGGLLLLWLILIAVFTPNMLLGIQRLIQPWTAAAPLPGPIVNVTPGDAVYAQGAQVQIDVDVKPPAGLSFDTGNGAIASATLLQHFTGTNGGHSPDLSLPMERTTDVPSNRAFRLFFSSVQQSFTYKVIVDGGKTIGRGESPTYTINVQSRPAVADVEVLYTYPTYTGLNPRTQHSREGALEALVGTQARLTIHATEPVQTAQLLIGDEGSANAIPLTPVAPSPTTSPTTSPSAPADGQALYTADITIERSTQYHIKLIKADGRDNPDNQARSIRAQPDTPPVITITQPDPKAGTQVVRPDDTVPLKFVATDDFGLTSVQALIQVDARSPQPFDIPLSTPGTHLDGDWNLNLPAILKTIPASPAPRQVTYQLRATDNRDPNPQSTLSQKQTLSLDAAAAPLAQRLDTQAAKDLASAVTQATSKLQSAQSKLDELRKSDQNPALSDKDRQRVNDIRKDLADAGSLLRQAADKSDDTRLAGLAQQFRDVANQPVKHAEEDAIKTGLAADQPTPRRASEDSAAANTQEALARLQQIADTLKNTANDQPLAQALENLAKQQQQLAEALAKNPNDPKLLDQQKQLQAQLDKLIKDRPELQKPVADANQARVEDLVRKLQQIEQAQQPLRDELGNMKGVDNAADQVAALARAQQDLNNNIANFNRQQSDTLRQTGAKGADPTKLDPIVKELQDNKLVDAARDQRTAETALNQAAQRLQDASNKVSPATASRPAASDRAAKDLQDAQDIQKRAQDLAEEVRQAQAAGLTRRSDPITQKLNQLADDTKTTAQRIQQNLPSNNPARTTTQNAAKESDAAKALAQNAQPDRAQQQLADAANQLAQAASAEQTPLNGRGTQPSSPTALKEATDQARQLASDQKKLADQTAALAKAQEAAASARSAAPTTAEQQRALANRIDDAARDAQSLQQQTQGPAPELANKAAQAAQALQQAADAQRQAAQSTRALDPADAAKKQDQASDRVATAEETLTGQPRPRTGQNPPQMASGQAPPQPNPATPADNNAPSPQNNNAGSPASPPQNSAAQNPGQNTPPSPGQNPPQSANPNVAQNPGQNPSQNPANSNPPGSSSGTPSSMPASPMGMGGQKLSPSGSQSSSAAQSVQAARASQSQAANGDPAAAQQAADQLAQATQRLMNNPANTPSPQPGVQPGAQPRAQPGASPDLSAPTGSQPGAPTGTAGQAANGTPNGRPGTPGNSGGGVKVTLNGRDYVIPQEVQDVGVAPSDWIRLPPDLQNQLLHSAQQPGPPEYRDQIKNYYSRIARLQSAGANSP